MAQAFVLIKAENNAEDEVLEALGDIQDVKEAYSIYGIYDLLARIEKETREGLRELVIKIRSIENVRSTITMICLGS